MCLVLGQVLREHSHVSGLAQRHCPWTPPPVPREAVRFNPELLTSNPFAGLPPETYSGWSPPQAGMVGPSPSHKVGSKGVFDRMGAQEVWEEMASCWWLLPDPPQPPTPPVTPELTSRSFLSPSLFFLLTPCVPGCSDHTDAGLISSFFPSSPWVAKQIMFFFH